ncbi:hypothetical protein TBLA_0A02940 [Henningerozyma blattae CBS 6284]|uniref:Glycosylphosphatidylinositol anchor biosynthesis protein 11 n=1 Tax=Henningerozyma blattae (strain ATCC 34711 / CBS 6284 / DSM 70876 / NBRC 10599 / NRRL Y-10934 / UCD 77-7) TaxID=1071380 RepID=I2GVE2_HENB6|nr:hypothetical protein TBLA_0A02940 [Tetrapisispora blattae CBS 6284]CCH58094.1 hypothetical protein TBLA_0A02940 [Tetrapisispora blattae CBS 6284]
MKKGQTAKKTVSFSDDTTMTTHNRKKRNIDHDHPPVFVRKTTLTIPWHLPLLLLYFIFGSTDYDSFKLLITLIPLQVLYLIFQFNKSTVYGNKIIKIKTSLLLICLFTTLLIVPFVAIVIILMGAPISSNLKATWLLSLHICYLSYPAIYSVFNCDFKVGLWKKYFIVILFGSWISCIVIPLDWDRDWQRWPVPIIIGSYVGAFLGYSIGSYV